MLQDTILGAFFQGNTLFYIIILAVLFVIAIVAKEYKNDAKDKKPTDEKMPYMLKKSVLTSAEFEFAKEIAKYTATDSIILTKVSLHDVFEVDREAAGKNYLGYLNKFRQKHVDFLICDRTTFKPLYGIELDDSSHYTQKAIKRDEFVDKLYNHVGLPLIHIKCKRQYMPNDFLEINKINSALSRSRV